MADLWRVLRCLFNQPSFVAPTVSLTDKTVVLTGPTAGGIGFETAKALATFGARVILAGRNPSTAGEAAAAIRLAAPAADVHVLRCDLASLDSVRAFAAAAAPLVPHGVDVLVCNAAALHRGPARKTEDGVELTFAACALGHHLLVQLVRPGRLVWVSGEIYVLAKNVPDPMQDVGGQEAYINACLARLLLAREWKRRAVVEGKPMEVVAVHPGCVDSDFAKLDGLAKRIASAVLISPVQGAQASILAASAPSAEIRQEMDLPYYHNKDGWVALKDDDRAMDETAAHTLFEKCDRICGIRRS